MLTWTWLGPCPPLRGSHTFSPWLTEPLVGQKLFRWFQQQRPMWLGHSSSPGSLGLASHLTFHLTGARSLHLGSGTRWQRAWGLRFTAPLHTIRRLTGCASGSTVLWKLLYVPASRTVTGSTGFHGSCWGLGPPRRKTYKLHLPSWFMASHWESLGILSLTRQFLGQQHNNELRSWTMPRFSHQFPHRNTASLVHISLSNFIPRDMCSFVRMLIVGPFNVPMTVHFASLRLVPKLLSWTLAVNQNMYLWTGWSLPIWT